MTDVLANAAIDMEGDEELHPLENTWCLWVNILGNKKHSRDNWGEKNTMVHQFDTVEDFWCLYNNINTQLWHGDIAFFKKGITPAWEDETCKTGGRWVLKLDAKNSRPDSDNSTWLNLVLALIGEEAFDGADNDIICGAVFSTRAKGPAKVALWLKTTNKETVTRLGNIFGTGLRASLGNGGQLAFEHFEKKAYTNHVTF